MPNLSPCNVRKKYLLYDNKLCTGDEAAESCAGLNAKMEKIGYQLAFERGDYPGMEQSNAVPVDNEAKQ